MYSIAEIQYDGQLSGEAYIVLAGIILMLVFGFSWCFYRAVTAANRNADEQHADEI